MAYSSQVPSQKKPLKQRFEECFELERLRQLTRYLPAPRMPLVSPGRLYTVLACYLGSLTLLGLPLVFMKPEYYYERNDAIEAHYAQETWIVRALAAVLIGVAAFILVEWLYNARRQPTSTRPKVRWLLGLALGWYLGTFALYYSIDGSFTRVGISTPGCYPHPIFWVFEPVVQTAWLVEWRGGGPLIREYVF